MGQVIVLCSFLLREHRDAPIPMAKRMEELRVRLFNSWCSHPHECWDLMTWLWSPFFPPQGKGVLLLLAGGPGEGKVVFPPC